MKVQLYGKEYDQSAQDAAGFLKSAHINVEFFDLEDTQNIENLTTDTKYFYKQAEYNFDILNDTSSPIVISPDTKQVVVGYDPDSSSYHTMLKCAEKEEIKKFIDKYPEILLDK